MKRAGEWRFTIVELMIVVAIVLILAAIAVPLVVYAQARAKKAEARTNIEAMRDVVVAADLADDVPDTGFMAEAWPRSNPSLNKKAVAWGTPPNGSGGNRSGFVILGFQPDGAVRCNYYMNGFYTTGGLDYLLSVECDVDGNGVHYRLRNQPFTGLVEQCLGPDPISNCY